MKPYILILCLLLSLVFAGCAVSEPEPPAEEESSAASISLPEPSDSSVLEPEPEQEPEAEPEESPEDEIAWNPAPQETETEAPPDPYPDATLIVEVVDDQGNPVAGVDGGLEQENSDIRNQDRGYIRWDDAGPGTYELTGSKDGISRNFELKMPADKPMESVTLTWNP